MQWVLVCFDLVLNRFYWQVILIQDYYLQPMSVVEVYVVVV